MKYSRKTFYRTKKGVLNSDMIMMIKEQREIHGEKKLIQNVSFIIINIIRLVRHQKQKYGINRFFLGLKCIQIFYVCVEESIKLLVTLITIHIKRHRLLDWYQINFLKTLNKKYE